MALSLRRGRRPTCCRVTDAVALRAPHLYQSLRAFCLAAFSVERGAELPFAFEEHPTRGGPSLYEYRPLVRGFVDEQAPTLRRLPDTRNAIDDLRREPAAAIFARAHARVGSRATSTLPRRNLPTRPVSWQMPSALSGLRPQARSPPDPSSSSGSTSGRCGSLRCFRSRRRSPGARPLGSMRCARGSPATCASA